MSFSRLNWALGALLLAAPLASSQVDLGGGSDLFSLVQRPAGARALALGSAFEALADDASALLWNPAAPSFAPGLGLSMHHETWLADTDREVLSAQAPVLPWLGLGLYGAMVSYSGSELRDDGGVAQGYFTPQEQSLGATASLRFGDMSVGLSGRALRLQLPDEGLLSMAGDLGLLWQAAKGLRVAAVMKALPIEQGGWRASGVGGVSVERRLGGWRMSLASSVRLDPEAASEFDLGLELGLGQAVPVAVRAGYSQDLPAFSAEVSQRFSAGLGVGFGDYQIDYAYLPWGSFGSTHRLSLSLVQPWSHSEPKAEPQAEAPTPQPRPQPTAAPSPQPTPLAAPAAPARETRFRVLSDAVVQARALEAAGRVNQALKVYHQAATADPDDGLAWKGMAGIYQRAGQGAFARQCWQQVLRLDPGDPDAQAGLNAP